MTLNIWDGNNLAQSTVTKGIRSVGGQIQYGSSRGLTSGGTPGISAERAARLRAFRQELRAAERQPDRAALLQLMERVRELGLHDGDILMELREIQAALEAVDYDDRLSIEGLPIVPSVDRQPPGEHCHFATPVRFGRRESDQLGHLEFTSVWLRFHGALDLSVVWSEVAAVEREGRGILMSLVESRRQLHFCCESTAEAARGVVIARRLAAGMASMC